MNANCSKCGSKLSGDVVEVAGMHFHRVPHTHTTARHAHRTHIHHRRTHRAHGSHQWGARLGRDASGVPGAGGSWSARASTSGTSPTAMPVASRPSSATPSVPAHPPSDHPPAHPPQPPQPRHRTVDRMFADGIATSPVGSKLSPVVGVRTVFSW
jgi:hypothetical protein